MRFILFILSMLVCSAAIGTEKHEPASASALFTNPYMTMGDFSPNGELLSMVVRENGSRYLSIFDTITKEITHLDSLGHSGTVSDIRWINDNRLYFELKNSKRNKEFVIDFQKTESGYTAGTTQIRVNGELVDFILPGSDKLLYAVKRPYANSGSDLVLITLDELLAERNLINGKVGIPRGKNVKFFYDYDKRHLYSIVYDDDNEQFKFYYRSFDEPKWHKYLTLTDSSDKFSPIGFINETTLAVLTNQETDKVSLYEYNIETESLGRLLYNHPRYDLVDATLSYEDGKIISVSYLDHGRYTKEYLEDTKDEKAEQISALLSGKQWRNMATHEEKGLRVVFTYGSNEPGAYYLYDENTNNLQLISSRYPGLDNNLFSKTHVFSVEAEDGAQIEAYLNLPVYGSHNTLLVMPHGGPIGIRENDSFNKEVQYFANRGYATLRINFRGSKGFGKKFLESGIGQFGQRIEADIKVVLDHVAQNHTFKNVCAMGASYGGYSSTMLAIDFPELIDCVVASYGIYDLPLLFNESAHKTSEEFRKAVVNTVGENNASLKERSPVYSANKLSQPIFLIAGYEDWVAPLEHTHRLEYVLKKYGKPVDSLYYRGTGHGHSNWFWDAHQAAATDNFLRQTLGLPILTDADDPNVNVFIADLVSVADSYNFNDKVDNDTAKAMHYFEQAAALNHPKSTYFLGALYYDGKGVEQDFNKAHEYFEKASHLGYSRSLYFLAKINAKGQGKEVDNALAVKYYQQAKDAGYNASVLASLARHYCFGLGVTKDVPTCVKYLSFKEIANDEALKKHAVTSSAKHERIRTLRYILTSDTFTTDERQQIQKLMEDEFQVQLHDIDVKLDSFGTLKSNKLNSETRLIDGHANDTIGVNFHLVSTDWLTKKTIQNALLVTWSLVSGTNEKIHLSEDIIHGGTQRWRARHTLKNSLQPGDAIVVDFYNIAGELEYSHQFDVAIPTIESEEEDATE